jgi:hypothetical protein
VLNNVHKKKRKNTPINILRWEFVSGRVVEEAEEKKEKLLGKKYQNSHFQNHLLPKATFISYY